MRVALELQPCCGARSGIGNYACELAKKVKDGDGLTFCGNLFNFLGRNDNSAALAGVTMPVRECRLFPYGVYRRIWDVAPIRYDSLFSGQADLSVFFNFVVPPRVSGKVLTTVHDMTCLRYPETVERRNMRRLRRGLARSIEACDRLITVSEFSRGEIVALLGYPRERIEVVPSAPVVLPGNGTEGVPVVDGPYLLYVGTIEPRKNLVRLIGAFERLKKEQGIPHKLVLAGGKGWNNGEIYARAESVEDVVFTGYVPEGDKRALYRNADAFVFPSLYEGFGLPPLEAMNYGCPVVTANAASLPEVVGDAAELVDPLDEVSIAEGIWRVLSDEAYARELVRRGRERVKKYTWAASAARLESVCRAVLGIT